MIVLEAVCGAVELLQSNVVDIDRVEQRLETPLSIIIYKLATECSKISENIFMLSHCMDHHTQTPCQFH